MGFQGWLLGDVSVFNPDTVADKATYENPHRYSVGVQYVPVNGEVVLDNGAHGREVRQGHTWFRLPDAAIKTIRPVARPFGFTPEYYRTLVRTTEN